MYQVQQTSPAMNGYDSFVPVIECHPPPAIPQQVFSPVTYVYSSHQAQIEAADLSPVRYINHIPLDSSIAQSAASSHAATVSPMYIYQITSSVPLQTPIFNSSIIYPSPSSVHPRDPAPTPTYLSSPSYYESAPNIVHHTSSNLAAVVHNSFENSGNFSNMRVFNRSYPSYEGNQVLSPLSNNHGYQEISENFKRQTKPNKFRCKYNSKYKTELCNKYAVNGQCPYGDHCQFIHEPIGKLKINETNENVFGEKRTRDEADLVTRCNSPSEMVKKLYSSTPVTSPNGRRFHDSSGGRDPRMPVGKRVSYLQNYDAGYKRPSVVDGPRALPLMRMNNEITISPRKQPDPPE